MFAGLLGEELIAVSTLRVSVPGDVIEPPDTAVFELGDGSYWQILVDDPQKQERRLLKTSDVELWGDYDDRTAVHLEALEGFPLPFAVSEIEVVVSTRTKCHWQDAAGESGTEYVVGAILYDQDGSQALGIRTDNDELLIESPASFRTYLKRARKGEILRRRRFGGDP